MQLIDADKAQDGMTIIAKRQTAGKGQRGKKWIDEPGQSLLMSIITTPNRAINDQFAFNASVAVAIVKTLQQIYAGWTPLIKWPNDLIFNDKKAGGILIENILRGSKWTHCVIGIGINVLQENLPDDLPFATSLKQASGLDFDIPGLCRSIWEGIMNTTTCPDTADELMRDFNDYLYKRGRQQLFRNEKTEWPATVLKVQTDGSLQVQLNTGEIANYQHGQVEWVW